MGKDMEKGKAQGGMPLNFDPFDDEKFKGKEKKPAKGKKRKSSKKKLTGAIPPPGVHYPGDKVTESVIALVVTFPGKCFGC